MFFLSLFVCQVKVNGRKNIPKDGPFVLAGEDDWPAGWEVANVNGGNEWEFGGDETRAHTGDGYAYKYYEGGSDDWLISPMLDVAAGDVFSFYARSYSSSFPESMNIMLSTTGGGDPTKEWESR